MTDPVPAPTDADRCPCGSGETFGACCGPLLREERRAPTAETLMRSRYTASAVGDVEHLLRTWHPTTRPARNDLGASLHGVRWLRLEVRETEAGGPFDTEGTVAFTAIARTDQGRLEQRELSRFVREDGTWLYVEGTLQNTGR